MLKDKPPTDSQILELKIWLPFLQINATMRVVVPSLELMAGNVGGGYASGEKQFPATTAASIDGSFAPDATKSWHAAKCCCLLSSEHSLDSLNGSAHAHSPSLGHRDEMQYYVLTK